jgi:hypothetical protein
MAEHLDDPAWKTLVARLHRASGEFTAVWERHVASEPRLRSPDRAGGCRMPSLPD